MASATKLSGPQFGSLAGWLTEAIRDAGPGAKLPSSRGPVQQGKVRVDKSQEAEEDIKANTPNHKNSQEGINIPETNGDTTAYTRKLVTIKKVENITAFDRNNNIIKVEGWTVTAPKNKKIKNGDLVIFLEVDTFLPSGTPNQKAFAQVGNPTVFDDKKGHRVAIQQHTSATKQTVVSQGHIYALAEFPNIWADVNRRQKSHFAGEDFKSTVREIDYSSFLAPGVCKWESEAERVPEVVTATAVYHKQPPFVKKTKMANVENCTHFFVKSKYKTMEYQETVKMDGASMTIYFVKNTSEYFDGLYPVPATCPVDQHTLFDTGRLGVCSANNDISFDNKNPFWRTAILQNYHTFLPRLNQDIVIQGELVGDNINGNFYEYPHNTHGFFVYSIYSIGAAEQQRWHPRAVEAFCADHGLRHVPVVGYHTITDIARTNDDLKTRANLNLGDEGLVFKNCTDGRWFKVLSSLYLLDKEEWVKETKDTVKAAKTQG